MKLKLDENAEVTGKLWIVQGGSIQEYRPIELANWN